MHIAVAGGTGFIGTHLCWELNGRGYDVTAISRSPASADLPPGVATVAADVTTGAGLADVLAGTDAIVNLVALSPLFRPRGGERRQQEVHLGGTRTLIRAAMDANVPRFVQMSAVGADPDALTAHLRAKGRAEGVVATSDREWVIIRPSLVFGEGCELFRFLDLLTTPYITAFPGGGRTRFQPIWVEDLVSMMADATRADEHRGNRYELGGPEVCTLADLTRAHYAARGQSVRIVPIPMPIVRLGLTVAGPLPLIPFGADQYRGLLVNNTVEENDVVAFGVAPEELLTIGDFLGTSDGAKTRVTQ